MRYLIVFSLVAIAGVLAHGPPGTGAPASAGPPEPACATSAPVTLCVSPDKELYFEGEPVELTLEITTSQTVTLSYSQSCAFDLLVGAVWSYLHGFACLPVFWDQDLQPGESLIYVRTWDQLDNDDQPVAPGKHEVVGKGRFCFNPGPICDPTSAPTSFVLTQGAVGGVAGLPEVDGSPEPKAAWWVVAATLAAAAAIVALGGVAWARRRS